MGNLGNKVLRIFVTPSSVFKECLETDAGFRVTGYAPINSRLVIFTDPDLHSPEGFPGCE
jgi:hypothetical protein